MATQRAEIGFAYMAREHAAVASADLCEGAVNCITHREHPLAGLPFVTAADLQHHAFIYYSMEQGLRSLLDEVTVDSRAKLWPIIEVNWVSAAWSLVNRKVGVALADSFSQMGSLYPDVAMRPFEPRLPLVANCLRPRLKPLSHLASSFVSVARSAAAQQAR